MGITNQLATEMGEVFNHWSKVSISDTELRKLIEIAMAPSENVLTSVRDKKFHELSSHYIHIVDNVFEYAMSAPSQQQSTTRGTVFGAYNAVTGYFQNVRKYSNEELKLKSIMFGTGLQRSQTAFELCVEFAKRGYLSMN